MKTIPLFDIDFKFADFIHNKLVYTVSSIDTEDKAYRKLNDFMFNAIYRYLVCEMLVYMECHQS